MIHIVHFLFLGSFDVTVSKIWGGSTEARAVMIPPRWMGRDGKLGTRRLLLRALHCKCGCYPAISYNSSLSGPPHGLLLIASSCPTFCSPHKVLWVLKCLLLFHFINFTAFQVSSTCHFLEILWSLVRCCLKPNGRGERRMLNAPKKTANPRQNENFTYIWCFDFKQCLHLLLQFICLTDWLTLHTLMILGEWNCGEECGSFLWGAMVLRDQPMQR